MSLSVVASLFFTVALLVVTAYFIMGSAPLLVLKHDTPLDARFVRSFFNIYYRLAIFIAAATAISYAASGRLMLAAGAAGLALLAVLLRGQIIPKMASWGAQIPVSGPNAIAGFRRTHVTAILVNLAQLVFMVWSLISFSIQLRG